MIETIRTYNTQFNFIPQIINEHLIKKNYKHIILCGMGGSHLPVGILKTIQPGIDIYVHKDYDLPPFEKTFFENALLIASSYSGNTAEVISFYKKAKQLFDLPVLCIATGGELLNLAQEHNDPYIVLPQTDFVPRTALGISTIALASVLKDKHILQSLQALTLPMSELENQSTAICTGAQLASKIPVFYTSNTNLHLGYNWKIKCNETAKIPAFCNVLPESNHNELESYDFVVETNLLPVFLFDQTDDVRIQKRFEIFEKVLQEKNITYLKIDISNSDIYQKVFCAIVLGDFFALQIAQFKNVPQAEVPLIESFKKRLI